MKKIDLLTPLGIVVVIAAMVAAAYGKLPGRTEYYLAAGAALVLVHLALRSPDIARGRGRQLRYGGNMAVMVVAVLLILGALNYLANRRNKTWDLSKGRRFSLSDQTRKILGGLDQDVTILYFQRATSPELPLGQEHMRMFEAASKRLKVEFVDPVKSPGKATEYDARGPYPVLVLERGSRRERMTSDSEQDVANALIKITRDSRKTVCFAEGEGERDIDDGGDPGFSALKTALGKSQYETQKVLLVREGKVPAACTVLVVAAPQRDLLPQVVDSVRGYVRGGGKALIMAEPEMKTATPNLVALLKEWNLEAGKDVVVDVSGMGQLFGTGAITPIVAQYPYHEITRDFRVMTAFHTARSLGAGKTPVDGVTAQDLIETSAASWGESDLSLKEPIEMNEGKDRKGPLPLGAVATVRASPAPSPSPAALPAAAPGVLPTPSPSPEEEPAKKAEGRVAAFGDADFASNQLLGFQGNQDFVLNTVAWLAEDADLISIRPREPDDQRLFLTASQQTFMMVLAVFVIPGLFVVWGIAAWWQRR